MNHLGAGQDPNDQHLLALVLRLKFYQRLGLLPKLDAVPAVVIDHVRAAIGLPEVVDEEDRDIRPVVRGGISCPVPVESPTAEPLTWGGPSSMAERVRDKVARSTSRCAKRHFMSSAAGR
jgi:hypothetical protein